jgi:enoyl-CoA hydratase/carnithine racemase
MTQAGERLRTVMRRRRSPGDDPARARKERDMAYLTILVETVPGVAILTLNRPEQLNAMNRQLSEELHDAVTRMSADDAIGCIVITGAGDRAFSAGGDIHEQR